jgi:hypothetical protein
VFFDVMDGGFLNGSLGFIFSVFSFGGLMVPSLCRQEVYKTDNLEELDHKSITLFFSIESSTYAKKSVVTFTSAAVSNPIMMNWNGNQLKMTEKTLGKNDVYLFTNQSCG